MDKIKHAQEQAKQAYQVYWTWRYAEDILKLWQQPLQEVKSYVNRSKEEIIAAIPATKFKILNFEITIEPDPLDIAKQMNVQLHSTPINAQMVYILRQDEASEDCNWHIQTEDENLLGLVNQPYNASNIRVPKLILDRLADAIHSTAKLELTEFKRGSWYEFEWPVYQIKI